MLAIEPAATCNKWFAVSTSVSLATTLIVIAVSSRVVTWSSTAVGGSLTGVTVMATVALFVHHARGEAAGSAHVHEDWLLPFCGQLEDAQNGGRGLGRRIGQPHADADAALAQTLLEFSENLRLLRRRRRVSDGVIAGKKPIVPLPDFEDAYETQRVLEAVSISARERAPVKLSDVR